VKQGVHRSIFILFSSSLQQSTVREKEHFQPQLDLACGVTCQLQNQVSEQMAELQTELQAFFHGPGTARVLSLVTLCFCTLKLPLSDVLSSMTLPDVEHRLS